MEPVETSADAVRFVTPAGAAPVDDSALNVKLTFPPLLPDQEKTWK